VFGVLRVADELTWFEVARRAASSGSDRPDMLHQMARSFVPDFGELDPELSRRLLDATTAVTSDAYVVPAHSSEARWVPSMLEEGFRWPRWRAADGFEPYEDKLAQWSALGPGERSEDFLFAGVHVFPRTGGFADSLARHIDSASGLANKYGPVTLAFHPSTLQRASILPAVSGAQYVGTRPGTIEHLPALIAQRIAGEAGFMAERRAQFTLVKKWPDGPRAAIESARIVRDVDRGMQGPLTALLDASRGEREAAVASLVFERPASFSMNPIESHVRELASSDVVHVDVRRPTAKLIDGRSTPIDLRVAAGGDPLPARVQAWHLIDQQELATVEAAVSRHGATHTGFSEQRRGWAYVAASEDQHGSASAAVYQPDEQATAVYTADLRRTMATSRQEIEAAGLFEPGAW
jgi:hypothetical protein